MSGDHNMYQNDDPARYGRNWNGHPFGEKNMMEQAKQIRSQVTYGQDEVERPKISNIQDQMAHMENHIHFLVNAIDTLESRLNMVLRDEPAEAVSDCLTKSMCPLASTLQTFNRRLDHASKGIMSLIDRLEV